MTEMSPEMSRSARSRKPASFVPTSDPTKCPKCGRDSGVRDSRVAPNGWRRRRVCPKGHLWSTLEVVVTETHGGRNTPLVVTSGPCQDCGRNQATLGKIARLAGGES